MTLKLGGPVSQAESRQIMLDLIQEIDQVCQENGLTYFLAGGTLLGAIRHQGFIPWDDDVDIMMPRPDFDKLLDIYKDKPGRFQLGSLKYQAAWSYPFARLYDTKTLIQYHHLEESPMGICLDIFPLDGLPESMTRVKAHYAWVKFLWTLRFMAGRKSWEPGESHLWVKKILSLIAKPIGSHRISKWIDKAARSGNYQSASHIGARVMCVYMSKERFDKSAFEEALDWTFEDRTFKVPKGYDHYLSQLYGNYMVPPSNPGPSHGVEAFYLEEEAWNNY